MNRTIINIGGSNPDIIKDLNNFLFIQKQHFENYKNSTSEFSISFLNVTYNNIEEKITYTINHFQTTEHGIKIKNQAKTACKELRKVSNEIKQNIILSGADFAEKQDELNTAFNFSLTTEKPMLTNYLEIEQEFLIYLDQDNAVNTEKPTPQISLPQHTDIFKNNGFVLFEYILENYVEEKGHRGRSASMSYFYRKLEQEKYIHAKIFRFLEWFNHEFVDNIKQIKKPAVKGRNRDYSTALDWFKRQSENG